MTCKMTARDWHRFAALLRLMRQGGGVGPSYAEMARAWGITSKNSVSLQIDRFEAEGLLVERIPARARATAPVRYLIPARDSDGDMVMSGALDDASGNAGAVEQRRAS